ncbi:MAG TPA: hypothetical protein DCQ06_00335 [Myxococcales bacterium]|nr:hypothetical protein [Myxococcales bacterium]
MRVQVLIQVPAWGFVKRHRGGQVDFVSPLPCPFNYGEIPGTLATDGDALDAVMLGKRLAAGRSVQGSVLGAVDFYDAGRRDIKVICGSIPLSPLQRLTLMWWFRGYAWAKRLINLSRGLRGTTAAKGWLPEDQTCAHIEQLDEQ